MRRSEEKVTIRMSEEEKWVLQDYANEMGLTMASVVRLALKEYFKKLNIMY